MRSLALLALLVSSTAAAQSAPSISAGGFVLPGLRTFDTAPVTADPNARAGFELRLARLTLDAQMMLGQVELRSHIEADLTSQFQMQEYWIGGTHSLPHEGLFGLTLGQFKTPFSRQVLVSDTNLQMANKAGLTTLAPGRQLGLAGRVNLPAVPSIELSAGMFNGDGINAINNPDGNFMVVGRLAFRPIGTFAPLIESGIGPDAFSVAVSASNNTLHLGDYDETTTLMGADAFLSWRGLSATAELIHGDTSYSMGAPRINFGSLGINVQAGYLLPLPGSFWRRFEIVARYEEVDRNDTLPIEKPGDPNQSTRTIAGGFNYFQNGHNLKLQVDFFHGSQIETHDRLGNDATFSNDTLLVQLTYRME